MSAMTFLRRLEAIHAAILVRHKIDGVDLVLVRLTARLDDGHGLFRLAGIGLAVVTHAALGIHQAVERNVVAAGDLIVVEVVGPGDLHRAGSEIRIGVIIGDDRDEAAMLFRSNRNFAELSDNWSITFIRWMNGDRAIAEHGFGPRCGDRDVVACLAQGDVPVLVFLDILIGGTAFERVLEMPHMAVDLDVLDLKVGNRGLELRVPVHQALVLIDQPFSVKLDKDLEHGLGQTFIHGEALTRPVTRCAKAFELVDDGAARLVLPRPDMVEELVPGQVATLNLALGKIALDHHLGGNSGMVHARLPEHIVALHALAADQDVLKRVVESVTDVQRTGDVGRRDDDGVAVGIFPGAGTGGKGIGTGPGVGDARLKVGGHEGGFHRHGGHSSQRSVGSSGPQPGNAR